MECVNITLPSYLVLLFQVEDHLYQLPINALPGVGYALQEKLKKQNVHTCGQLQMISKVVLFIHLLYGLFWFFLIFLKFNCCYLTFFWRSLLETLAAFIVATLAAFLTASRTFIVLGVIGCIVISHRLEMWQM